MIHRLAVGPQAHSYAGPLSTRYPCQRVSEINGVKGAVSSRRCAIAGIALGAIGSITGCVVGPNYPAPATQTPGSFEDPYSILARPTTQPSTQPSVTLERPVELVRWWTAFNDPEMTSLIERAIARNLDLRIATSRVLQVRAQQGIASSAQFPSVDTSAAYSRSHSSGSIESADRDSLRAGLDAAWELDVFGGIHRSVEAARADTQAAIEDRRDVLILIVSQVGISYIQLRGFQQQIVIARENLAAQERSVNLAREKVRGGTGTGLDVANAEAQVATTTSTIPSLESLAQQTIYTLSLLLGQPPAALTKELAQSELIPTTPPRCPSGFPPTCCAAAPISAAPSASLPPPPRASDRPPPICIHDSRSLARLVCRVRSSGRWRIGIATTGLLAPA